MDSHPQTRTWHRWALTLVAALAPVLILVAPGSAQAGTADTGTALGVQGAVPLPSCSSATLCTFQNANYNEIHPGSRWDFAYNSRPHDEWFYVGSGANDQISSFFNNRAWISYFARNCPADANNWAHTMGGFVDPNLTNDNWPSDGHTVNDTISAIGLGTNNTHATFPAHGVC